MHIVLVKAHVIAEYRNEFISATQENAADSIHEPGIVRFDFLQLDEDPDRFLLIEVYLSKADPPLHRETVHYNKWRGRVENMLIEARTKEVYTNIFPPDTEW